MKILLFVITLLFSVNATAQDTSVVLIIHFDFDKYDIRDMDAETLDAHFTAASIPQIEKVELYGHCDFIGNHAYNDALSRRRVDQVRTYLLRKGMPGSTIVETKGYGKRQPLNENKSPEERSDNRRVEVVITWLNSNKTVKKPVSPGNKPDVSLAETIKDTATKAGTTIILRNIQFIPGRHFLLPESQPILDELYQVMVDNPTLVIEIQGHVCCTADNEDGYDIDKQTLDLSVQRAKAIYEHLVERNIPATRMSYKGFGGSRKLFRFERNEFERQENRRVELKIVSR